MRNNLFNWMLSCFFLLFVFSCKDSKQKEIEQLMEQWYGKELLLPKNLSATIMGDSTVYFSDEDYLKTNWILATVTGIFILLFILIYVCLDKKNARECLQNEQKGITTVRLLPLFYRIMLGCTALFSVVYMILVLFPNESVSVFVYSFFGAFTLFCATVTIMMRLWKIEFDEGVDYFHYRSSYGIKHKIYYSLIKFIIS